MTNRFNLILLLLVFVGHFGLTTVGWKNQNLPGMEFRQAQTGLSTYFIQQENNFSLAYPTPVLGKPWSIPMEMPFYQWTVAGISKLTGWNLTSTARGVSLACFYLTLPAVFIFLRHLGLTRSQIALIFIPILTCPLYIFYSRAFLIETMALMFSVWFAVAYVETVRTHRMRWFVVATIGGVAAGTIKVTTLMVYLMPCAGWTVWLLLNAIRQRSRSELVATIQWGGGTVILPGLATLGWTRYADHIKSLNIQGEGLTSKALTGYNFGTWADRFSGEIWQNLATLTSEGVLAISSFGLTLIVGAIWGGRWRWPALIGALCFVAAPLIFPQLYARHDYYFMATAIFLMMSVGFIATGLEQSIRRWWVAPLFVLVVSAAQLSAYHRYYFEQQALHGANGPNLALTLRGLTDDDEVLVIIGDDWNSMIPYYARRRALMFFGANEMNPQILNAAFDQLADEKVGALVLTNHIKGNLDFVELAARKLGIAPGHFLDEENAHIYLHRDILHGTLGIDSANNSTPQGLSFKDVSSSEILGGRTWRTADIPPRLTRLFHAMSPAPVEVFFEFGPGLADYDGMNVLNANAVTKLRFEPPEDVATAIIHGGIIDGAWQQSEHPSDGVTLSVKSGGDGGEQHVFFSYDLSPAEREEDRGLQRWVIPLAGFTTGSIVVEVGPGPQGSRTSDWFYFTSIELK